MEHPATSFRTRIYEPSKSETGLAEWTNKIKSIQRQDEELEQTRLKEEIAASRLARQRRSRGGVGYGSRMNSLETFDSTEFARVDTSSIDDPISTDDRQKRQEDALRKLTATTPLSTPRIQEGSSLYQTPTAPPVQKKPESISLAAFMGGRATGPRLNKHAPQQDAHDPTQFEQRTRITAPHPIFGKGGVAMPGMVPATVDRGEPQRQTWAPPIRAERERDRTLSNVSVPRRSAEMVEPLVAHQMTGRERTMSTPGGATLLKSPIEISRRPDFPHRPLSSSSSPESGPKTPSKGFQPCTQTPKTFPPPAIVSHYHTRQQPTPSGSTSPAQKSAVNTPSLARPIVPEARRSLEAPRIPPSQNLSPAFLRPPAQRDPTPSISRLQGRGFVQNMVRASTQLESASSSYSPSSEKGYSPNGRKSAVLDRWQPAASTSCPSLPPPVSPKSPLLRKARTMDPSTAQSSSGSPKMLKHFSSSHSSLKSASSLPSMSDAMVVPSNRKPFKRMSVPESMPPEGAPGLGSSSTLISYIKPTKTGDDPLPLPARVPSLDVNELGIRTSIGGAARERTSHKAYPSLEPPAPSGNPLSHPTKDRARKPRKTRESADGPHETASIEQPSGYIAGPIVSSSVARSAQPGNVSKTPPSLGSPELRDTHTRLSSSFPDDVPNTGRVSDRWADQHIIGIKPLLPRNGLIQEEPGPTLPKPASHGMVGGRALPGLAQPQNQFRSSQEQELNGLGRRALPGLVNHTAHLAWDDSGSRSDANGPIDRRSLQGIITTSIPSSNSVAPKEEPSPSTPTRHSRIPSTGNRATVMDVAQALHNQHDQPEKPQGEYSSNNNAGAASVPIDITALLIPPRRIPISPSTQNEKRKSSYEKYSAIILPSLQEEKTPVPSPAATLSRSVGPAHEDQEDISISNIRKHHVSVPEGLNSITVDANTDMVRFDHNDEPLPSVDIDSILKPMAHSFVPDANIQPVSVDVMAIVGNTATAISRDTNVFYDTEILAIIHRSKSKSSGLVSTAVWAWRGKRSQAGEREERKLQELAKRYGAILEQVHQHSESPELVHLLGGQLAIRQGTRAHWSSENTAMHLVRSYHGVIFLDEYDLNVKNLCSGFSYCLSILDMLYVWYGRGSTPQERFAALEYARSLAAKGSTVIELTEGEKDNDEMFWMILGDEEYAKADYWKWRRTASVRDPRIWRIDVNHGVHSVSSFLVEFALQSSIYVIDCVWEYFVLVGRHARGKRQDIRLAISLAMQFSDRIAASRPYTPTIHVLVLPTQLPLDFRLHFRDVDEALLNDNDIPDHMNIIGCKDALAHLGRKVWEKASLKDHSMLPLGLNSSDVP